MGGYINFNGNIISEYEPVFKASSRAARFGDGLFETMRARKGKILFEKIHSDRLFAGLALMRFSVPSFFTWHFLRSAIGALLEKNQHHQHARVRLMVTRGDGGIMEDPLNSPQFLIESWNVDDYTFEEKGLKVGVFRDVPKARSAYANMKSCNYLPSVMAALHAKEKGLDECLLVNDEKRICDAAISNIFWVKDGQIFTTPLSEGAVSGVMRSYLFQVFSERHIGVIESPIEEQDLHKAEELFLTNVVRGVRWVSEMDNTHFTNDWSRKAFELMISSLDHPSIITDIPCR